jgi:hypothetical protein
MLETTHSNPYFIFQPLNCFISNRFFSRYNPHDNLVSQSQRTFVRNTEGFGLGGDCYV